LALLYFATCCWSSFSSLWGAASLYTCPTVIHSPVDGHFVNLSCWWLWIVSLLRGSVSRCWCCVALPASMTVSVTCIFTSSSYRQCWFLSFNFNSLVHVAVSHCVFFFLTFPPLMADDVERIFICSFANHVSSLVMCAQAFCPLYWIIFLLKCMWCWDWAQGPTNPNHWVTPPVL
jgi:hypothetical protein